MALRLSTGVRDGLAGTAGLKGMFDGGFIRIYTGGQPSSADDAETGTELVEISTTAGTVGVSFGTVGSGNLPKSAAIWSGIAIVAGVGGWFRLYDSNKATGSNGTARRIDGNVGVSGSDLVLGNSSISLGATVTIDTFTLQVPSA